MRRRVAEQFYLKGMVADTFFYHIFMTLLKFSEKRRRVEQILWFH